MWICKECKSIFSHAGTVRNGFTHAFGTARWDEFICPTCGSDDVSRAIPCANPRDGVGAMLDGDIVCRRCRNELLERFQSFLDELTDAEINQLEDWLDGNSIRECKEMEVEK